MSRRLLVRSLSLSVLVAAPFARAQQPLTVEQVMDLRTVTNPVLGDGFVAWNVVVPRPLADGPGGSYLHAFACDDAAAMLRGEGTARALVGGKDSTPGLAARPGHRAVTFLQRIDGAMQLVQMPLGGGEAEPVAKTASILDYRWRPDGAAFAFTTLDPMPADRAAAQAKGFRPNIVDEDWRHRSLWLCEVGGEPRRLTRDTTVFGFEWSPDGARLALACAPRNLVDDSYVFQRLFALDAATGERRALVDNPGKLGDFAWSPDGGQLVYVSAADRNDPHAGMLYRVDAASGEVEPWTHGLRGMIQHVRATAQGYLLIESLGVRTRLRHVGTDGADQWVWEPKAQRLAIDGVAVRGDLVAFTASSPQHPSELFAPAAPPESEAVAAGVRLTDSNPVLADAALAEQSVERFRARDGLPIEGLLIAPLGVREGERHPLVIVAHGGPEAHHLDGWLTSYAQWGQLLAARGCYVWFPNYRASTGYGVEFCKQDHGDPMGREFEDHLDAIAHFDALGLIDPARVGIGGGSYGGYTAAWAATRHSAHFACAVSFVPFVDIRTKWLTSDIPFEFYHVHYQELWPWQQPGLLQDRSPLTWATQCRTPLLLLGGTDDPRVHPSQPFMLYRAVKFGTDTPVRYVQYPGEGHGNRTNVYRYDYALRTLRWFDWYLQEQDTRAKAPPPFDVPYELPG
ncbi:MAG: prolyl oligopeptidase family serine peptidase [Planctomycetota bacterium]